MIFSECVTIDGLSILVFLLLLRGVCTVSNPHSEEPKFVAFQLLFEHFEVFFKENIRVFRQTDSTRHGTL